VWGALDAIDYRQALVLESLPKPNADALLDVPIRMKGEMK
jgi:hypothetical protein